MRRSKVDQLPKEVRDELDRRLVDGGFSDYRGLSSWLADKGFRIGSSSLCRYGGSFEERLKAVALATRQAAAIAAATANQEQAMTEALMRLVQQKLWSVLVETNQLEDAGVGEMVRVARAVADLSRAAISQKRWDDELRSRLAAHQRAAEQQLTQLTKARGLSPDTAAQIRAILLGIDPLAAPTAADDAAPAE